MWSARSASGSGTARNRHCWRTGFVFGPRKNSREMAEGSFRTSLDTLLGTARQFVTCLLDPSLEFVGRCLQESTQTAHRTEFDIHLSHF